MHEMETIFIPKYKIILVPGSWDWKQELIQEFICKYDCIKKLHISDKTLTKALTRNVAYNNNYFKTIGSKLQI